MSKKNYSEGFIKVTIEGEISGCQIPKIWIIEKEVISPKYRDKAEAKWRLEQSLKNVIDKILKRLEPEPKIESKIESPIKPNKPISEKDLDKALGE